MSNSWLNRAMENLFIRSYRKEDFQKTRREWFYKGLEDNQYCAAVCELCNHKKIRYEYTIINILTGKLMVVGSECVKKFTDDFKTDFYDTKGNLVNENRLTKDNNEYFKKVLGKALDERLSNSFYKDIVEKIKKGGKLTPNQLKDLHNFYLLLDKPRQQAFENVVKVSLRKGWEQEQINRLSSIDLRFVTQIITSQQRKIVDTILKLGNKPNQRLQ